MRARRRFPWPGGIVACATILLSLSGASQAAADTKVRFLHAVPGGPTANLTVTRGDGKADLSGVAFGKVSPAVRAPSGAVTVKLSAGGKELASASERLAAGGTYTIVAEKGSGSKPRFRVYRAGTPAAGKASVRAVNAAPELGKVEVSLGGQDWGTVGYGQDTGYKPADPGTYELKVMKPGTKSALATQKGVTASSGSAATAYAVGSAGEPTRFVVVADAVAAPSGAPATGLGGMAGSEGAPWLVALLAALAAGTLGGVLYTRAPRGRARG